MRYAKLAAKIGATALVTLLLFVACGEWLLRYRAEQTAAAAREKFISEHPGFNQEELPATAPVGQLAYYWDCYVGLRYVPDQQVLNKRINTYGYHDTEWTRVKAPGTYRIALFGGSVVDGNADSEMISGYLQEELRARHPEVEVINCGLTGMMSTQELILLCTEVLDFAPDMVINYNGINELSPLRYGLKPGEHFYWYFGQYNMSGGQSPGRMLGALATKLRLMVMDKSHLLRTLLALGGVDTVYSGAGVSDAQLAAAVDRYYHNRELMQQLCAARGISTLWFMQPIIFEKRHQTVYEAYTEQMNPPAIIDFYRRGYRIFHERRQAEGLPLRMDELLDSATTNIFSDPYHTYPEGGRMVARRMAAEVAKVLAARRPVPAAGRRSAGR